VPHPALLKGVAFTPKRIGGRSLWLASDRSALTSYLNALLALSPAGVWLMQDSSGAPQDSSGNARHLTANGAPTYAQAGPNDEVPLAISGYSNTVFFSSSDAAFKTTGALSVVVAFRYTNTGVQQTLVARDVNSGAGTRDFEAYLAGTGIPGFQVFDAANTASTVAATGGQSAGSWNLFVGVHTPSANLKIYINGADVTASAVAGPATRGGASAGDIQIGKRAIAASFLPFGDRLAAVAYFPSALSAGQVSGLYDAFRRAVDALPNAGSGAAAQATAARKPTLVAVSGKPTVQGAAGQGMDLTGVTGQANGFTAFFVGAPAAASGVQRFVTVVGGAQVRVLQQDANSQVIANLSSGASNIVAPGIANAAAPDVFALRVEAGGAVTVWKGLTRSYRRYGQLGVDATDAALATGTLGNYADYASGFTGYWKESLVVGRPMSDGEIERTVRWLAGKHAVALTPPTRNIVFDGDSITAGFPDHPNYYDLALISVGGAYKARNVAIPGQQLTAMASAAASRVDAYRDPAVAKNVLVIWGGTNDIASGTLTGAQTHTALSSYCTARRAAGWKVVVVTMLPRSYAGDVGATETERTAYNTAIRANWATYADALADVAANTTIGDAGDELNATNYQSDHAHLKTAGATIVAGIVAPAVAAQ
jgi:lysophospholipase L1-like esterase